MTAGEEYAAVYAQAFEDLVAAHAVERLAVDAVHAAQSVTLRAAAAMHVAEAKLLAYSRGES